MVLFNYSFGKAKPKAPASFFSGEPWFKNFAMILTGNPFTGISYVYINMFMLIYY